MKCLSREARIDAHDQHRVAILDDVFEHLAPASADRSRSRRFAPIERMCVRRRCACCVASR